MALFPLLVPPHAEALVKQLFAKKSIHVLLDEMAGDHRLRRVLGPVALTALGVGAIIGTGIFVLVGQALMTPWPGA